MTAYQTPFSAINVPSLLLRGEQIKGCQIALKKCSMLWQIASDIEQSIIPFCQNWLKQRLIQAEKKARRRKACILQY